ncbi:hypothetical protein B0H19DRAFT_1074088 [Mycena capillaripes]|nr:hypothetical protein B0H19DRAFT_1074088 [Mycena capillaripes]
MPTFMNFTGENTIKGIAMLGGAKSKTTRRANTAERRATHNAVERQRRETLNGRFMDLAGMLSNLRQIRRPSKSAIVNSAIAHLNASRRHRILAAHELRMMKDEADTLRHELNVWRARSGAPFVEEPMRGDAFGIVLRGELEFEAGEMMLDGDEGEEDEEYAGRQRAQMEEYALRQQQAQAQEHAHAQMLAAQQTQRDQTAFAQHAAKYPAHPEYPVHAHPAPVHSNVTASPVIADPILAALDNPAAAMGIEYEYEYEHPVHAELGAKWAQQQMLQAQYHQQQLEQRQGSW